MQMIVEQEKSKPVGKCNGRIYADIYDDGKFSFPICKKGTDLAKAEKMRKDETPCELKRTCKSEETIRKETAQEVLIKIRRRLVAQGNIFLDDLAEFEEEYGVETNE